jgi:hypothetical protein
MCLAFQNDLAKLIAKDLVHFGAKENKLERISYYAQDSK